MIIAIIFGLIATALILHWPTGCGEGRGGLPAVATAIDPDASMNAYSYRRVASVHLSIIFDLLLGSYTHGIIILLRIFDSTPPPFRVAVYEYEKIWMRKPPDPSCGLISIALRRSISGRYLCRCYLDLIDFILQSGLSMNIPRVTTLRGRESHSSYLNNNQPGRQLLIASSASTQPYWAALRNRSIERAMPTKTNSTFASSLGNEVANVFSAMRTSSRADSTLLAPAHPGGTQRESKPADATVHLTPANTVCQPILTMLWTQSIPSHSISRGRAVRSSADTLQNHWNIKLHQDSTSVTDVQSEFQWARTLQQLWISMNDHIRIRPNKIKSDPVQHYSSSVTFRLIRYMDHPSRGSLRI